jgi:glucose/mannose-6-phosphate isomerase
MNLDQFQSFSGIDRENMLGHIDGLPDQLLKAWELGSSQPLPAWEGIEQVLVAGMGGSAIGADLLSAYVSDRCAAPVLVHRDYGLPAWARGPKTLVIASSHSGNTEETLDAFGYAAQAGCKILAICTGGKLAEAAQKAGAALWIFEHHGQPRAAVGFSFGLLLAAFSRLKLIPNPDADLRGAVAAMRTQQQAISVSMPVAQNSAKRLAGQLVGRIVSVFGSGVMAPVARRWKGQISELAKAWAQFEFIPEANHNTLAGTEFPQEPLCQLSTLFLRAACDLPRNRLRGELTRKVFMQEGLNTDVVDAQGDTALSNLWTALHLGDYVAFYLAMIYEVDPTPIAPLLAFKQEMQSAQF